MTIEQHVACYVAALGVLILLVAFLLWTKPQKSPRLYFHVESSEWRTDGSQEMIKRAMEAARVGERIVIPLGTFEYGKEK